MANSVEFRQLVDEETNTYTYLLFDQASKEGVIIDPVLEKVERDVKLINELGIKLKYILDTHVHADHITGSGPLRDQTGAQIVLGAAANLECADVLIKDQAELTFGNTQVKALATPGHTAGCTSFLIEDRVFTGDTVLIRGCGRTDFQQGDAGTLYDVIHSQIFSLPDATTVYPGHDYKGMTSSTVGEEKEYNPRLGKGKTRDEFIEIMDNLNLAYPKKLDVSLPGNMKCGQVA